MVCAVRWLSLRDAVQALQITACSSPNQCRVAVVNWRLLTWIDLHCSNACRLASNIIRPNIAPRVGEDKSRRNPRRFASSAPRESQLMARAKESPRSQWLQVFSPSSSVPASSRVAECRQAWQCNSPLSLAARVGCTRPHTAVVERAAMWTPRRPHKLHVA